MRMRMKLRSNWTLDWRAWGLGFVVDVDRRFPWHIWMSVQVGPVLVDLGVVELVGERA